MPPDWPMRGDECTDVSVGELAVYPVDVQANVECNRTHLSGNLCGH